MNRLITFEGVDGCGKSTQLAKVAAWLRSEQCHVVETFEPGDTQLGAALRKLLLGDEYLPVAETELLLFLADRAQHVREVVAPALQAGSWVLCDRYSDSTMAYQLAARKLRGVELEPMLRFAECGVRPALTLWFDLPVTVAAKRMKMRCQSGEKATRLDSEAISFHQRVADAFAAQYENDDSGRVVRIDARGDIAAVFMQVKSVLQRHCAL